MSHILCLFLYCCFSLQAMYFTRLPSLTLRLEMDCFPNFCLQDDAFYDDRNQRYREALQKLEKAVTMWQDHITQLAFVLSVGGLIDGHKGDEVRNGTHTRYKLILQDDHNDHRSCCYGDASC